MTSRVILNVQPSFSHLFFKSRATVFMDTSSRPLIALLLRLHRLVNSPSSVPSDLSDDSSWPLVIFVNLCMVVSNSALAHLFWAYSSKYPIANIGLSPVIGLIGPWTTRWRLIPASWGIGFSSCMSSFFRAPQASSESCCLFRDSKIEVIFKFYFQRSLIVFMKPQRPAKFNLVGTGNKSTSKLKRVQRSSDGMHNKWPQTQWHCWSSSQPIFAAKERQKISPHTYRKLTVSPLAYLTSFQYKKVRMHLLNTSVHGCGDHGFWGRDVHGLQLGVFHVYFFASPLFELFSAHLPSPFFILIFLHLEVFFRIFSCLVVSNANITGKNSFG